METYPPSTVDVPDFKVLLSHCNWIGISERSIIISGLITNHPSTVDIPDFQVLSTHQNGIGVSRDISAAERIRLRSIAKALKPEGFGLIVRTVAADRSINELTKDLEGLLSTWKDIMEHAKSAALAADEDVEGDPYVMLHSAMGQTLSIVQDYFSKEVNVLSLLNHSLRKLCHALRLNLFVF